MLYAYKKATDNNPSPGHTIPQYLRLLPATISIIGFSIIASVIWPIVSYNLSSFSFLKSEELISPLRYDTLASNGVSEPKIVSAIDYTRASNWFSNSQSVFTLSSETKVNFYTISIPSLDIFNAKVSLTDDNLSKHLIHYPQTALPGQKGSSVIFGHSTLPQFFNPQDYMSIFSTLPNIKHGDQITIKYDNINYLYQVVDLYEVKPSDTHVLLQDYNQTEMKLITCVPPGTKLKRLVVESKLIKR